jgi:hypothetical protein
MYDEDVYWWCIDPRPLWKESWIAEPTHNEFAMMRVKS